MVHGEFARRYLDLPYCLYPFAAWYATIVPFFSRSGREARSHVPYLIPFSSFDKIFHWKATFSTVDDSQLDSHSQNGLSRFYQTDILFVSILKFHPRDSLSIHSRSNDSYVQETSMYSRFSRPAFEGRTYQRTTRRINLTVRLSVLLARVACTVPGPLPRTLSLSLDSTDRLQLPNSSQIASWLTTDWGTEGVSKFLDPFGLSAFTLYSSTVYISSAFPRHRDKDQRSCWKENRRVRAEKRVAFVVSCSFSKMTVPWNYRGSRDVTTATCRYTQRATNHRTNSFLRMPCLVLQEFPFIRRVSFWFSTFDIRTKYSFIFYSPFLFTSLRPSLRASLSFLSSTDKWYRSFICHLVFSVCFFATWRSSLSGWKISSVN